MPESEVEQALLTERARIAQELHDTVCQCFAAISLHVESVDGPHNTPEIQAALNKIREISKQGLLSTRQAISSIYRTDRSGIGLSESFATLVQEMSDETGLQVDFQQEGVLRPMSNAMENHLYRVGQEALSNAIRHGNAEHIQIALRFSPRHIHVTIEDDGGGFDLESVAAGYGITGMQGRADAIRGNLQITSTPGKGTVLHLVVEDAE